jgi:hypothetical protein
MIDKLTKSVSCALLLLLAACRPDFSAEQHAVESMLGVLTNVESASEGIDSRTVRQYVKDVADKCSRIQIELHDTLSIADAQKLVSFCALEGHLRSCLERKDLMDAEIMQTKNQLLNLRRDLVEATADKDSVNTFVETEFLFVESLDEGMEQVITELNSCFKQYATLNPEIDRLLVSLPSNEQE